MFPKEYSLQRCDVCGKRYNYLYEREVHNILGEWVCIYCYPSANLYCDCCGVEKRKGLPVVVSYVKDFNSSLFDF